MTLVRVPSLEHERLRDLVRQHRHRGIDDSHTPTDDDLHDRLQRHQPQRHHRQRDHLSHLTAKTKVTAEDDRVQGQVKPSSETRRSRLGIVAEVRRELRSSVPRAGHEPHDRPEAPRRGRPEEM